MTKVVNIKKYEGEYVYCGRPSKYGNPHPVGQCDTCGRSHTREEAINEYRSYFNKRIVEDKEFRNNIHSLKGKTLGCFCKPKGCHCDVIAWYLENEMKKLKFYTGIGSRSTPPEITDKMNKIGFVLAERGYTLRSGGAEGADSAFEDGCDVAGGKKEIYLPWKNFNKNNSQLFNVSKEALELAKSIHPAWGACSFGAKKLHGRNCYQVMGEDLSTPSDFLICWTLDGQEKGGTRTAIVLAKNNGIPVYNLAVEEDLNTVIEKLKNDEW